MDNETGAPTMTVELQQAFEELTRGFEAFKDTNDQRLRQIETKAAADVVTTEKLQRIEAALDANTRRVDDLALKNARPSLAGGRAGGVEHKSAFNGFLRAGDDAGLRALERKALTAGASDGGFNVPIETEVEVMRRLSLISPIRSIAAVRQVSSSAYRKPVIAGGLTAGWAGEAGARDEDAATFTTLQFDTMELYAMPAATTALLDDSAVDLEAWLAEEVEGVFAEQETKAFVAGSGTDQPKGFTTESTVEESSWSWGDIGVVKTGVNGDFPATQADKLIDLVYTLKSGYRQNAHFVMNRETQAAVRKIKDTEGNYLWTPPAAAGTRAMLMTFPVVEAEDMPAMNSASGNAIAFGDFRRGYLIVDRQGLRVLRDPYSKKPFVLFYVTKRVGGGVQDYDAIKMLQFKA